MAVGTYALTSLEALKRYLNLTVDTYDTLLEELIDRATAQIEEYTDRKIKARDYSYDSDSDDYDSDNAVLDGNGLQELALPQYPIVSVTTVRISELSIDESTGVYLSGWFADKKRGILRLRGYEFTKGRANIELEYSAGFASIPDELAQAAIEQASWMYRQSPKGLGLLGVESRSMGDGSSISYVSGDLLPQVKRMVERYRKRFAI